MSIDTPTALIPQWGDSSSMTQLSGTLIANTNSYVDALKSAADNLYPPVINMPNLALPGAPIPITVPLPALIDVTFNMPSAPGAFNGTLNIGNFMPAPFNTPSPSLNFGTAPAQFSGSVPASPPIDLNFVYPTVALSLPTAPQLMSLTNVTFNPLVIPTFDVTVPDLTISPPSVFTYVEGAFYTSTELSAVQASLMSALTDNTDTGLSAATQQAMWDAARERELRQQAASVLALDQMESLGYAFPAGVYLDARIKIVTETNYTLAGLSREIMVKQAELRLENVVKARDGAVQLESKLIDYYNQIAQRTFEAAKYYTEAAVQIYNAQVTMFQARLEGYKTQAIVYDTQVKAIEAQVEELKAQIAFEQTKAEINTALVNQYKVQVDAALANLEIFKTQAEIIQIQASVEKTKVDVFSAQIQAYVGQVNAYTAQVEGYKAGIEAQTAIENVYKTQVEAYSVEVEAGVKQAEALIEQYKGQIEAYTAQLEAYKASLQAQVSLAQSQNLYNTSEVELYKGEVSGVSAYNQALTSQWEAIVNEQVQIAGVAVKAAEANAQMYISARGLSLDAAKVGAQVMAQLGAAALNTIHWMNSSSWSLSDSLSVSQSNSTSTSTNTNYNSSV